MEEEYQVEKEEEENMEVQKNGERGGGNGGK